MEHLSTSSTHESDTPTSESKSLASLGPLPGASLTVETGNSDSFATEIIIRILELAAKTDYDAGDYGTALRTLAATSLVARRWREPAQGLMWKHLYLLEEEEGMRFATSQLCERIRTAQVILHTAALKLKLKLRETLDGVIARVVGLEVLEIQQPEDDSTLWDTLWLNFPSLRNLTALHIDVPFEEVSPRHLRSAFHLHDLIIGSATNSRAVVDALIGASTSTLSSVYVLRGVDSTILASIPLLAKQLTSLAVDGAIAALPVFSTLASLKKLSTTAATVPELDNIHSLVISLPSALETITLRLRRHLLRRNGLLHAVAVHVAAGRRTGWEGLTAVRVLGRREDAERNVEGGRALKFLTVREIQVTFDGE